MKKVYKKNQVVTTPAGTCERIFEMHFNNAKDESGNTSVIVPRVQPVPVEKRKL